MDWINDVPIDVQGLPNLTWAIYIWGSLFLVCSLYFIYVARQSWRAYRYQFTVNNGRAERLLALGRLLLYIESLLICFIGVAIGIASAARPHVGTRFMFYQGLVVALFMGIPMLKLVQVFTIEQINKIVAAELRMRAGK